MATQITEIKRKNATQKRAQATVAALLQAATHILKKEGLPGLNTNHIAATAGVSIGSLYQYFPNKESILRALQTDLVEKEFAVFASSIATYGDLAIEEMIPKVIEAQIEAYKVEPLLHKILNEQYTRYDDKGCKENDILNLIDDLIVRKKSELRPLNAQLTSFMIFRAVDAIIISLICDRPELLRDSAAVNEISLLVINFLKKS